MTKTGGHVGLKTECVNAFFLIVVVLLNQLVQLVASICIVLAVYWLVEDACYFRDCRLMLSI